MDESKTGVHLVIEDWDGKYRINEGYRPIAEALVEKYPELEDVPVDRILFVSETETAAKRQGRPVMARVSTIPGKWMEIIKQLTGVGYWYLMTIHQMNVTLLSEAQRVALVYHELRHIGDDGKTVPHDIADWENVVATLGPDWDWPGKEIPNLLDVDIDWSFLRAKPLPGLEEPEASGYDDAKITIAAAGRSVTTDLGVLKEAAGRVKRAAGSE